MKENVDAYTVLLTRKNLLSLLSLLALTDLVIL